MSDELIRWAGAYISQDWPVFMLATDGVGGKNPPHNCPACDFRRGASLHSMSECDHLTCHAFHAATLDVERFGRMREMIPTGYLGIRTGSASRLLVLDAEAYAKMDGEPSGLEVLDEWETWVEGGWSLPPTRRVRTVSGGLHLYYRIPDGVKLKSGRVLPNVDVKAEGGYVAAPCGLDSRTWEDWGVSVADAPHELVAWLISSRRMSFGRAGVGGEAGHSKGYDYVEFAKNGCPDGHRDEFFNDLLFRLRKQGLSRERYEETAHGHWSRCAQPPEARYEMPWEDVAYKLDYVWNTVDPDQFVAPWSYEGNGHVPAGVPTPPESGNSPPPASTTGGDDGHNVGPWGESPIVGGGGTEHATDSGNAQRFARLFTGKWLYIPGGPGWHRWSRVAWEPDVVEDVFHDTLGVVADIRDFAITLGEDEQRQWVRHAQSTESMRSRVSILKGASTHPRMKISYDRVNTDPYLMVVPNGTLELRSQKLRESHPADYNTQVAGVAYDPEARCLHWLDHIKLVTAHKDGSEDPELALFIQKWCGYTLTGLVSEQKFFFGHGDGNNGKNTIIETLIGIMGTYGMTGSSKLLLGSGQEHETIIADLAGARMAFVDETPKGRVNEARIKQLTGTGRLRARKIARDSFEFDAKFKLWIAGNNKPRVSDTTEGFWRRLDLVPFDVEIPSERRVKDYATVLRSEWPGILNWALDGLAAYLDSGLEPPTRVADARAAYRDDENSFGQFVEETFAVGSADHVWHPNRVIHSLYKRWCSYQGIDRVMSMQQLTGDLERNHFVREVAPKRITWIAGETRVSKATRGWVGPAITVDLPIDCTWDF